MIIGHRQPDTDSIASAIGYAAFKNHAEPDRYIAARCGELNAETCFALEHFGLKAPVLIDNVHPRVSDLKIARIRVTQDVPALEVATLMDMHDIRNVPVTDNVGRLIGIVGERGLARAYVSQLKSSGVSIAPFPIDTLARIFSARIVVRATETLGGRVIVVLDALDSARKKLAGKEIAVVGDNEPVQQALIASGIAALIIADHAPVSERVIREAKARGVSLLATDLDAFGIGTMVNLSLPARLVMETDIPRLALSDTIAQAKQTVYSSKFRSACIVENDGTLCGIVTRTTLLAEVHRRVILVDHNEFAQSVDGIDEAEILEIIDHHRLGAISTLKPVKFLNDPVGSTSTIIAGKYRDAGITPPTAIAGILLAGILSDTLILKMSTTTPEDHNAVAWLAPVAGVDPLAFGTHLLGKGMNLEGTTIEELLMRDTKRYELAKKKIIIAQVMVPSFEFPQVNADAIQLELSRLRIQLGVDLYIGVFTSVVENGSDLFASGERALITKLDLHDQPVRLKNMMSRKKDILPWFGEKIRKI